MGIDCRKISCTSSTEEGCWSRTLLACQLSYSIEELATTHTLIADLLLLRSPPLMIATCRSIEG
jgi:hypothetical protein